MEVTIPEHVHAGDELLVTHNSFWASKRPRRDSSSSESSVSPGSTDSDDD